jgi:hypothetical protein
MAKKKVSELTPLDSLEAIKKAFLFHIVQSGVNNFKAETDFVDTYFKGVSSIDHAPNATITLTSEHYFKVNYIDSSAGNVTVTIPDAPPTFSTETNKQYWIWIISKYTGTGHNEITIKTTNDNLIGNNIVQKIKYQSAGICLISNNAVGSKWDVISDTRASMGSANSAAFHTGLISGGEGTINADPTKFDIAPAEIKKVNRADTGHPDEEDKYFPGITGVSATYLDQAAGTYVGINFDNLTVVQQVEEFTPNQLNTNIIKLFRLGHFNRLVINDIYPYAYFYFYPAAFSEWVQSFGTLRTGKSGGVSNNGATLELKFEAAEFLRIDANRSTQITNPHFCTIQNEAAPQFYRSFRSVDVGRTELEAGATLFTTINSGQYDDGTGTLANVPVNKFQILDIIVFPGRGTYTCFVAYGQKTYNSLAEAETDAATFTPQHYVDSQGGNLFGQLIVQQGTLDLSLEAIAKFLRGSLFGMKIGGGSGGGGGGGVTPTFEQIYLASLAKPQITTDITHGTIQEQQGVGAPDKVRSVNDTYGVENFSITGRGDTTAKSLILKNGALSPNNTFYATYQSSLDANFGYGSLAGTATVGTVEISLSQELDCSAGAWHFDATNNIDFGNIGVVEFTWKPSYSGNPTAPIHVIYLGQTLSASSINLIGLYILTDGVLKFEMYRDSGSVLFNNALDAFPAIEGKKYKFQLFIDIENGNSYLKIDGVQFGATQTTIGNRTNTGSCVLGGSRSGTVNQYAGYFSKVAAFDPLQESEILYFPDVLNKKVEAKSTELIDVNGNKLSGTEVQANLILPFDTQLGKGCYASFKNDLNLDVGLGVLKGTAFGAAKYKNESLDLSSGLPGYLEYDARGNISGAKEFTCVMEIIPAYSGAPGADSSQRFLDLASAPYKSGSSSYDNQAEMFHGFGDNNQMRARIRDVNGVILADMLFDSYDPVAGTPFVLQLSYSLVTLEAKMFINKVQLGTTKTITAGDRNDVDYILIGALTTDPLAYNQKFKVKKMILVDKVLTPADYELDYSLRGDPTVKMTDEETHVKGRLVIHDDELLKENNTSSFVVPTGSLTADRQITLPDQSGVLPIDSNLLHKTLDEDAVGLKTFDNLRINNNNNNYFRIDYRPYTGGGTTQALAEPILTTRALLFGTANSGFRLPSLAGSNSSCIIKLENLEEDNFYQLFPAVGNEFLEKPLNESILIPPHTVVTVTGYDTVTWSYQLDSFLRVVRHFRAYTVSTSRGSAIKANAQLNIINGGLNNGTVELVDMPMNQLDWSVTDQYRNETPIVTVVNAQSSNNIVLYPPVGQIINNHVVDDPITIPPYTLVQLTKVVKTPTTIWTTIQQTSTGQAL